MKYQLLAVLFIVSTILFWVVIYTLPTWLVWNCIISTKFGLPTFTFAETFFVLTIVKFIFSPNGVKESIESYKKK